MFTNPASQQEQKLSDGLIEQANELQLKILRDLVEVYRNKLLPGRTSSWFDRQKVVHRERVKIVNFLFQKMTMLDFSDGNAIKQFLDEFAQRLKNKEALREFLQKHIRQLKDNTDIELFVNAFKRCENRNFFLEENKNKFKSTLTAFFSRNLAEVEVLQKKLPPVKQGDIAIIVLDRNYLHPGIAKYKLLSAQEQIDPLVEAIQKVCADLTVQEPNSTWVMVAPEYVINKRLDKNLKKYFKNEMTKLTQQFPRLKLIPGTIGYERSYDVNQDQNELLAKLKKMDACYDALSETIGDEWSKPFAKEAKKTCQSVQHGKRLKSQKSDQLKIYSNNCYGFQNNKNIQKIKKMTPTPNDIPKGESPLMQPGTHSHFLKFNYATDSKTDYEGEEFAVAVEICREHASAIVLEEGKELTKPLIHFLLSDYIYMRSSQIFGEYFVQVDTDVKSRLILTRSESQMEKSSVRLYQFNLLDSHPKLLGPLQPLYPFECRVQDRINETIVTLSEANPGRRMLETFRDNFKQFLYDVHSTDNPNDVYDWLETEIDNLFQSNVKSLRMFSSSAWPQEIKKLIADLEGMLKTERAANPKCRDIMPDQDAPEMKLASFNP